MGRFGREKQIRAASAQGGKGKRASPKNQFKHTCGTCGGSLPCNNSSCRRAVGQASYSSRKTPVAPKAPKAKKVKVKKAKLSWGQKSKIRKNAREAHRRAHPSASDSAVNRAGRKAVRDAKKKLK